MTELRGKPNILVFLVDNLGFGELGCFGGGVLRGAETTRIDAFAREGMRLTNFAPEAQCTPTRSALMTGRFAVRSGTYKIPMAGPNYGLVAWERTLAEQLYESGYATSLVGKWHLGETTGRWPGDHGFETWFGPERTYDESLWSEDPYYDDTRDPIPYILEAGKGEQPRRAERLTLAARREIDVESHKRARDFMKRSVASEKPFFLLYCHSMMHLPTVPRHEFSGKSKSGDWGDSLLELDSDFGSILDELDSLGCERETVVIFLGDNGAEESRPWHGSSGMFDGSYFTGMEGSLRTPCLIRHPDTVPVESSSNEPVHVTDLFTSILGWAEVPLPPDREIDGVDQRDLFEGKTSTSARQGFPFWNSNVLFGVKWHNWKITYYEQRTKFGIREQLGLPKLVNLLRDPHELDNVLIDHTWVMWHVARILDDFDESLRREELIPFGAPVTFVPTRTAGE